LSGEAVDGRPRVLIAEDDAVSRRALEATLAAWGYPVVVTVSGTEAWAVLGADGSPALAVLDWMMPGLDGVEVCRRIRAAGRAEPPYVLMLTAKDRPEDAAAALEAGADDYLVKPFNRVELRARLRVGERTLALQRGLAERVRALERALAQVKQLQSLLPMCAWCRKIRNDANYWQDLESYVVEHSDARFTHGICPECRKRVADSFRPRYTEDVPRVERDPPPAPPREDGWTSS
jgi:sigma-B regulation protein RsbU (phosphoserine phosphatase)